MDGECEGRGEERPKRGLLRRLAGFTAGFGGGPALFLVRRLEEERRTLSDDVKEVYAEAKGTGFDPTIMRQIIRIRRMDKADLDEQETILDLYKRALGMIPDVAESTERAVPPEAA